MSFAHSSSAVKRSIADKPDDEWIISRRASTAKSDKKIKQINLGII